MNKYFHFSILTIVLFFPKLIFSQQEPLKKETAFGFHSFYISPISVYYNNLDGGAYINTGVSINIYKNIIKVSGGGGGEVDFGGTNQSFFEANILYGREFYLTHWLDIDTYAGVGFIDYFIPTYSTNSLKGDLTTIAFPAEILFRLKASKHFHTGINLRANLNKTASYFSGGLFLQFPL